MTLTADPTTSHTSVTPTESCAPEGPRKKHSRRKRHPETTPESLAELQRLHPNGQSNLKWPSLEACPHERLQPGHSKLPVYAPNHREPLVELDSTMIIRTKGTSFLDEIPSGVDRAPFLPPQLEQGLCHCAHFFFNRFCRMGAECGYVHAVHVDPSAEGGEVVEQPTVPRKGSAASTASATAVTDEMVAEHHETASNSTRSTTPQQSTLGASLAASLNSTPPPSPPAADATAASLRQWAALTQQTASLGHAAPSAPTIIPAKQQPPLIPFPAATPLSVQPPPVPFAVGGVATFTPQPQVLPRPIFVPSPDRQHVLVYWRQ